MKRYSIITAAVQPGTKFYSIELEDALEVAKSENLILYHQLYEEGWEALDFDKNYWGSEVVDDIFYLCVTDGNEITVDGTLVDPEYAIADFGVDAIQPYVVESTPEVIKRYITPYELGPVDLDKVAYDLLGEDFSFMQIFHAARDADLLEY